MSNDGTVNISPEELIRVCDICLDRLVDYDGSERTKHTYEYFSWRKLKKVKKVYYEQPRWIYRGAGIIPRLKELRGIAYSVLSDKSVQDKDIKLSLTTYSNLYKMLNKDNTFEPHIFGMGY